MVDVHIDGIIYAEQPRGGISRMWTNILRRLPDHGCRVHLYLPRKTAQRLELPDSIKVLKYPREFKLRPGRLFRRICDRQFRAAVDRMWAGPGSGVFHSTHFTTYPSLRIPQIVTVHDLFHECLPDCFEERERVAFTARRRLCIERGTGLIAVSEATLDAVRRIYANFGGTARVVHHAVEPAFHRMHDHQAMQKSRNTLAEGRHFILYVGTRFPYKNFSGLLAAYALWANRSNYRLVVIGPEASCHESAQIRAFRLNADVHFRSPLSDFDLAAAYNAASAVVVPSLSEGFGLPIWEAMACGTPVVAARVGSLPEVGQSTPVYFDLGPPPLLANALDEAVGIARDSERIREGIRRATCRTWDDVAREYSEVYHDVNGAGGRQSVPSVTHSRATGKPVKTDYVA